jgi:hypothetical protein
MVGGSVIQARKVESPRKVEKSPFPRGIYSGGGLKRPVRPADLESGHEDQREADMRRLIAAIVALAALVLGGGAGYSGF